MATGVAMKRINSSSGVRERQRDHTGRNKMTQDEHSLSLSLRTARGGQMCMFMLFLTTAGLLGERL